jgi:N-acetylglucosaminyldiphosphoundecaprenol N-acetyl-beta-D-mannosaminyltransferase
VAERLAVLGVPVDAVAGIPDGIAEVEAIIRHSRPACQSILAVNPEKVMAARKNPDLMTALRHAALLIPDGIGVVLAARMAGHRRVRRVPGIELMEAICIRAAERGWPVFLLGARPDVNERAARELQQRYPRLVIAGRRDGFFKDEDNAAIVDQINRSGAAVIFVALGSPKQELWMERNRALLGAGVCQGVGGSFDVFAGEVRRAPALFRRLNLEWFYRLVAHPGRLLRQTALPGFVIGLAVRSIGRRIPFRRQNAEK